MIEQEMKPTSPEALYNAINQIKPTEFDDIIEENSERDVKPGVAAEFTWRVKSQAHMDLIPKFEWDDIFGCFHLEHQKKKGRK